MGTKRTEGEEGSSPPQSGQESPQESPQEGGEDKVPSGLRWFLGGSSRQAGINADAAYTLVGGILGLGLAGYLIDRWRGSYPTGLLIGMLIGGVIGFYKLGRAMLGKR